MEETAALEVSRGPRYVSRGGEKLHEALMTPEEAVHSTESGKYFKVEPLQPASREALSAENRGYDSEHEEVLSVDQIVELLESRGLVDVFAETLNS